jgi:hypothetical protein
VKAFFKVTSIYISMDMYFSLDLCEDTVCKAFRVQLFFPRDIDISCTQCVRPNSVLNQKKPSCYLLLFCFVFLDVCSLNPSFFHTINSNVHIQFFSSASTRDQSCVASQCGVGDGPAQLNVQLGAQSYDGIQRNNDESCIELDTF